ncbi:hypothetical protein CO731_04946 [Aminobacter sp. MSH1]|uniref:hypothetical protein n=1 Tax=Aminobacter sp. MSH1 TaxID=374606 RepID=UPI000D3CA769|nr:hypothetical protein [Aminobacter sp. MSH1]AWC25449.1 hypothetical protein CO731_04946 [Aminobacter sp. MSH1]
MSDPTWPVELPPAARIGISGGPQSNAVSFQPEVGPSIDRLRASTVVRKYQVELPPMESAAYDVFMAFFTDTLASGILPFQWYDPFTRSVRRFKFVHNAPVYSEQALRSGLYVISFEIMRLD